MVALSFYVTVGFDEVIIYVMCIMYVETFYVTSIFAYSKERIYYTTRQLVTLSAASY